MTLEEVRLGPKLRIDSEYQIDDTDGTVEEIFFLELELIEKR